jgi:hypothetical protein
MPGIRSVFEVLENCWVIIGSDGPLTGWTPGYKSGPTTPAFRTHAQAVAQVRSLEETGSATPGPFTVSQMGNPRGFMLRAASYGVAAISPEGDWTDVMPGIRGFQFMTRFSEAGHALPTILEVVGPEGPSLALGAAGAMSLPHHDLDHWRRFDIIDRASARFGARNPFHGWHSGDVFYEVLNNVGDFALDGEPGVAGSWTTFPPEYVPIFVERENALEFAEELSAQRPFQAQLRSTLAPDKPNPYRRHRTYHVAEVRDLAQRLLDYKAKFSNMLVVINPDGHRANTGIAGRGAQKNGAARWWTEMTRKESAWLRTTAGLWRLGERNTVTFVDPAQRWSGRDTFFWDGGGSVQLADSPYSLAMNYTEYVSVPPELTREDIRQVAEAITSRGEFLIAPVAAPKLNSLVFVYWYLGDSLNKHAVRYPSIFHLIADLAGPKYTFNPDANPDSPDEPEIHFAPDSHASPTLTRALTTITEDILANGYSPRHAQAVIRVCNATEELGIHLEVVGYVRDILLNCNESEIASIRTLCNISIAEVDAARSSDRDFPVHPHGEAVARARVGPETWEALSRESRYFLATAFWDWDQRRECRFLDYATISVEISKAVEVELRRVLASFSRYPNALALAKPLVEKYQGQKIQTNEVMISRAIAGTYKPTLGNFAFWLNLSKLGSTPVESAWRSFLQSHPDREWLCQPDSAALLQRIVDKYRNGGAHDSPITIDVCREGMGKILGDANRPGYLTHVVKAINAPV